MNAVTHTICCSAFHSHTHILLDIFITKILLLCMCENVCYYYSDLLLDARCELSIQKKFL